MSLFSRNNNKKLKQELKSTYRFIEQPYDTVTAYNGIRKEYIFEFYDNRLQAAYTRSIQHANKWIDITVATLPIDRIMCDLATEFKKNQYNLESILKERFI